jgi:hypothetical protein
MRLIRIREVTSWNTARRQFLLSEMSPSFPRFLHPNDQYTLKDRALCSLPILKKKSVTIRHRGY